MRSRKQVLSQLERHPEHPKDCGFHSRSEHTSRLLVRCKFRVYIGGNKAIFSHIHDSLSLTLFPSLSTININILRSGFKSKQRNEEGRPLYNSIKIKICTNRFNQQGEMDAPEHYESGIKEKEEKSHVCKDSQCSWILKFNIITMFVRPKSIYR